MTQLLCVCVGWETHTCTHVKKQNIRTKWGGSEGWFLLFGTHMTSPACALLTLPFALAAGEASGAGGVVSLGLRRRPFS